MILLSQMGTFYSCDFLFIFLFCLWGVFSIKSLCCTVAILLRLQSKVLFRFVFILFCECENNSYYRLIQLKDVKNKLKNVQRKNLFGGE